MPRVRLAASALPLALLLLCGLQTCLSEEPSPRATAIEDAILQRFAPPDAKQAGRQVEQEREQKERRQAHEAAQAQAAQGVAEPTPRAGDTVQTPDERRSQQQQQQQQQEQQQRRQAQQARQAAQGVHAPGERPGRQQQQQPHEAVRNVKGTRAAGGRRRQQQEAAQEEAVRRRQAAQDAALKRAEAARAAQAAGHDRAAHEAAHADLLEAQRRQAVAQAQRLQAAKTEQRQAASLGRGSLRDRRAGAARPLPPVTGSRPGDVFAERTEKALGETRARLAARREQHDELAAKLQAAAAASSAALAARTAARTHVAAAGGRLAAAGGTAKAAAGGVGGGAAAATGGAAKGAAGGRAHIPLLYIVLMTLAMAAAAGLGALPFFFVRSLSDSATGVATAVACGVMLAASFDLVHDGQPYGAALTVGGVLLGGAFIAWVQQQLAAYEDIEFGSLQGSAARKTALMVGIMAAHALGEGCAVGVSFCGERGWAQGLLTTLAIGVHNVPEGLAKATVLVGQGVSARRALAWSVATCLPQPLVAVPSFMFVDAFAMILPVALGFAAGCMVWMVLAELLPDALEKAPAAQVATAATVSAAGLEAFRMLFAAMDLDGGGGGGGLLGGGAAAAGTAGRMAGPLLVLLPAVAAAAAAGGALGGSAAPPPMAWGVAAAAAAAQGGAALLNQLLWRPAVPALHTAAAGAAGGALALLLHRQLLAWAGAGGAAAAAARKLLAKGGGGGAAQLGREDVEALEYASLYQQHHLHHSVHASHPLYQHNGAAAPPGGGGAPAAAAATALNGWPSAASQLGGGAHHRGGAGGGLPGTEAGAFGALSSRAPSQAGLASGAVTPNGGAVTPLRSLRGAGLLPPGQAAAAGAALAAMAGGALACGAHLACTLLLLGEDRSAALLPAAALLLAGPGLGGGALARALPGRRGPALGAALGGGLAALAALAAALVAARTRESAHVAAQVRALMYPLGVTDTLEAVAGGALATAATLLFGAGVALRGAGARGGAALGGAAAALLGALRYALCWATPYCLSVQLLLRDR